MEENVSPPSGTPDEEIWNPPKEYRGSENDLEDVGSSLSRLSDNFSATNFNAFAENVNSQHLDKWLQIEEKKQEFIDKENERRLQIKKMEQETSRFFAGIIIGGVLCIFLIVFLYAGFTKDIELPKMITHIGIGAIAGIASLVTYNNFKKQ